MGTRRGDRARKAAMGGLAVLALAVCGCGGDARDPDPSPKTTVVMTKASYRPAHVTLEAGGRVTFFAREGHTAETDGVGFFEFDLDKLDRLNRFDTHILQPGEAMSVEFDTPGTYEYHSSLDADMRGVVEVVANRP